MATMKFEVNEIHIATYHVDESMMSPEDWQKLTSLETDNEKAEFLRGLNLTYDFEDNSSEFSRMLDDTMRNFELD